jgi:hypothetical protein
LLVALAAAALLVAPSAAVAAVPLNPYAGKGADVSSPQGTALPTTPGNFGIVGVNSGRPYRTNTFFPQQYDWARDRAVASATVPAQPPSIYMNLAAPVGKSATQERTSTPLSCKPGDTACKGYNYGYNAAADALQTAGSRMAATWWIDVETANSWLGTDVNRRTIQGAVDYLRGKQLQVGIYSYPSAWSSVTGGWQATDAAGTPLPAWFAGTDKTRCPGDPDLANASLGLVAASSFTGGPLWLVQNASGATNGDRACSS